MPCIMRWPGVIPTGATCPEVATALDFFPTFAGLTGAPVPGDRVIDGKDIASLLNGSPGAVTPHEAFFYYLCDNLEAVRAGSWKLHVAKGRQQLLELYDLVTDPGETTNLAAAHPEIVRDLQARLQACREDLGDGLTGTAPGQQCRPAGRVANPVTLTTYDPEHPYIISMYDLPDAG